MDTNTVAEPMELPPVEVEVPPNPVERPKQAHDYFADDINPADIPDIYVEPVERHLNAKAGGLWVKAEQATRASWLLHQAHKRFGFHLQNAAGQVNTWMAGEVTGGLRRRIAVLHRAIRFADAVIGAKLSPAEWANFAGLINMRMGQFGVAGIDDALVGLTAAQHAAFPWHELVAPPPPPAPPVQPVQPYQAPPGRLADWDLAARSLG